MTFDMNVLVLFSLLNYSMILFHEDLRKFAMRRTKRVGLAMSACVTKRHRKNVKNSQHLSDCIEGFELKSVRIDA